MNYVQAASGFQRPHFMVFCSSAFYSDIVLLKVPGRFLSSKSVDVIFPDTQMNASGFFLFLKASKFFFSFYSLLCWG